MPPLVALCVLSSAEETALTANRSLIDYLSVGSDGASSRAAHYLPLTPIYKTALTQSDTETAPKT